MIRLTFTAALALAGAIPCTANDTSASVDAGGLVFRSSASIQIKSEVLSISAEKIEADYVFANRTNADVTTVVAFPLPDLDFAQMFHALASIPFRGQSNFVGFRTWVDGAEIHLMSDIHAVLTDGRDITKELQSLGVSLFDESGRWPPETGAQLKKIGAAGEEGDYLYPTWSTKTSFYWTQTFPARKDVSIRHTYNAGPFRSLVTDQQEEWCTDDSYKAAFRKLPGKVEGRYLNGEAVRYVLKTGANWAGPIGDFTLKLDKAGTALLSTCPIPGLSLKRQGNLFIAHAENFAPRADLNILFVRSPAAKTD
jgi:hypothetical protein